MKIFDAPVKMVRTTNNYSKFEMHHINRDVSRTSSLEKSMMKYGFFVGAPIVVFSKDGKLIIKSGHHRFCTARDLGLPINYIVCEEFEIPDIYQMENSTKQWALNDYLTSQVRGGSDQYHLIEDFHERTGIPLGSCIALLAGNVGCTGNYTGKFKNGSYNIKDIPFANAVGDIVIYLKQAGIKFAANNLFVNALSKCIRVADFNSNTFKQRAKKRLYLFEKQQSALKYLNMIESIYNHSSKTKIPLTFLAENVAKSRSIDNLNNVGNHK